MMTGLATPTYDASPRTKLSLQGGRRRRRLPQAFPNPFSCSV